MADYFAVCLLIFPSGSAFSNRLSGHTADEGVTNFNITQRDLENVVATLRHCELVRGQKEGDKVYLVPF